MIVWISLFIFAWIAIAKANMWLVFLAMPCAAIWSLGHLVQVLGPSGNYSNYVSGLAIVATLAF